jgi:predicted nucleic-acid-binding protein
MASRKEKEKDGIILDANVIIRYLLQDNEELYRKAEEIFNKILTGEIKAFIPTFIFAEVVYVLQKVYQVDRMTISEVLLEILKVKHVKTENKEILQKALEIFGSSSLDFADCLLCAYSTTFKVLSFDKKLNKCIKSLKSSES